MMKSKTLIEKQLKKKTSSDLVETIILAKKKENWQGIASTISGSRRNRLAKNLNEISKEAKTGELIVIPGKVLSMGEIDKKIKIVALSYSEKAKEKLIKAGCEVSYMIDEIKKNPDAKGIKILR